jgi:exosortase F-associated protein
MQKNPPRKFVRVAVGISCLLLLISVRAFERELFYDPFLNYFESDYLNLPFPDFDTALLLCNIGFRYFLNMILSLGIIYMIFLDTRLVKFSALLYGVLFAILLLVFCFIVLFLDHDHNFTLFYVRRFLIQPLFLLLFVPAFYYQLRLTKK